jgi:cytochrome c-type biogenesis protein CcmF
MAIGFLFGIHRILYLIVIGSSTIAIAGNILVLFHQAGPVGLRIGGFMTHVGFGVMLVGILVSSAFSQTDRLNLFANAEPQTVLGHEVKYKGLEGSLSEPGNSVLVEVESDRGAFEADPEYFDAGRTYGIMRRPYIKKYPLYDLYLSPQDQQYVGEGNRMILSKGESGKISDYNIRFIDFDMSSHVDSVGMSVGAILEVTTKDSTEQVTPYLAFAAGGKTLKPATLPEGGSVAVDNIAADAGMVSLEFAGVDGAELVDVLVLEVSRKPLINLVWVGLLLICIGTFISFVRRRRLQLNQG